MAKLEIFDGTNWITLGDQTISLPLDIYTSSLSDGITIYNSNNSATSTGFWAYNQNTDNGVQFGLNSSTSEGYVWASSDLSLKFGTNGIMRMKINSNGSINCQSNDILTTGTINATTGTLKANNLSSHNSSNINVLTNLDLNNNILTTLGIIKTNTLTTPSGGALGVSCAINMSNSLFVNTIATYSNSSISCHPLYINAGYFAYNGNYGYLNPSGNIGIASGNNLYSINATYRVKASEFNAVSSIKKKRILSQGVEIEKEVVDILKKTEFFKYQYIDQIAEKGIRYGIIAEELAKTLPDYVDYDNMEYITNIMQVGKLTQIAGGTNNYKYILKLKNKIEIFNDVKKLKLVDENNKVIEALILNMIGEKTLEIKTEKKLSKKVFVYGTYEQCPSVASKVTELALIAFKNLLTRVEILEKRIYE